MSKRASAIRPTVTEALSSEYSDALKRFEGSLDNLWYVQERPTRRMTWRVFRSTESILPRQGWKLHVTASAPEASYLVESVLPVLRDAHTSFKIPSSLQGILYLNSGLLGSSQVGKILTIYPRDPDAAQLIANTLAALWPKSRGPVVPTDIPVTPSGSVSARYGVFAGEATFDCLGRPSIPLIRPDGDTEEDVRGKHPVIPPWAPDPPMNLTASGITRSELWDDRILTIGESQYVLLACLTDSVRSRVYLGLDTRSLKTVIVKSSRERIAGDVRGYDASSRLVREHTILCGLQKIVHVAPIPLGLLNNCQWAHLVMDDSAGVSLNDLTRAEQLRALPKLAEAVCRLHEAGIAHRDLKLANALLLRHGVQLIDFGLASPFGCEDAPVGGTINYMPPEAQSTPIAANQDIYAMGMLLAGVVLSRDPALLPVKQTRGRVLGLLSGCGSHEVLRLVRHCTSERPALRPSATFVMERMHQLEPTESVMPRSMPQHTIKRDRVKARTIGLQVALASRGFVRQVSGMGHYWHSRHTWADYELANLNYGAAGAVLALVNIASAASTREFHLDIEAGATWLTGIEPMDAAHGLFTGNAGVALALAAAGKLLDRPDARRAARSRIAISLENVSEDYDLFSGLSGVILSACLMDRIEPGQGYIDGIKGAIDQLMGPYRSTDPLCSWPSHSAFDPDRRYYFGAAHGASGIALSLSFAARALNSKVLFRESQNVFRTIAREAVNESSTNVIECNLGSERPATHWCHGVAGYLWCLLLSNNRSSRLAREQHWATNAFLTAAERGVGNPTFCHGLAGNLEIMRLLNGTQPSHRVQVDAAATVRMMRLLIERHPELGVVWCSEEPLDVTPDLMVGFLGPAVQFTLYSRGQSRSMFLPTVGS
jgi:hypothetical protein